MTMAAPKKPTAAAKPRARKAAPPAEEVTSDVDQAATSEAPARAPRASQKPAAASATPPESAEAETPPPAKKKRGPYNVVYVQKKPVSIRLPDDALELMDWAKQNAASRGDRLTKDEIVTVALRAYWGRKRRRG